jgi:hypothetical protein
MHVRTLLQDITSQRDPGDIPSIKVETSYRPAESRVYYRVTYQIRGLRYRSYWEKTVAQAYSAAWLKWKDDPRGVGPKAGAQC